MLNARFATARCEGILAGTAFGLWCVVGRRSWKRCNVQKWNSPSSCVPRQGPTSKCLARTLYTFTVVSSHVASLRGESLAAETWFNDRNGWGIALASRKRRSSQCADGTAERCASGQIRCNHSGTVRAMDGQLGIGGIGVARSSRCTSPKDGSEIGTWTSRNHSTSWSGWPYEISDIYDIGWPHDIRCVDPVMWAACQVVQAMQGWFYGYGLRPEATWGNLTWPFWRFLTVLSGTVQIALEAPIGKGLVRTWWLCMILFGLVYWHDIVCSAQG